MPKFVDEAGKEKLPVKKVLKGGIPIVHEPRCKVCTSPQRNSIDKMLAAGFTYSEIERQFGGNIPRKSISGHSQKHLNYEQAAIREVIEKEAVNAQQNYDMGVSRLVTKNAYLEVALQKAYDALVNNDTMVEPKDAVKVIEMLQRLQDQNQTVALDELRVQFQYFMQAVKETIPKEQWESIVDRTADLLRSSGRNVDWGQADEVELVPAELEEIVDAEVIGPEGNGNGTSPG
jgi:hypothetical protein